MPREATDASKLQRLDERSQLGEVFEPSAEDSVPFARLAMFGARPLRVGRFTPCPLAVRARSLQLELAPIQPEGSPHVHDCFGERLQHPSMNPLTRTESKP